MYAWVVANSANWYVDWTTLFFSYRPVKSLLPRSQVRNELLVKSDVRSSTVGVKRQTWRDVVVW